MRINLVVDIDLGMENVLKSALNSPANSVLETEMSNVAVAVDMMQIMCCLRQFELLAEHVSGTQR